jgi:putative ABC transport system substrate-binding protein
VDRPIGLKWFAKKVFRPRGFPAQKAPCLPHAPADWRPVGQITCEGIGNSLNRRYASALAARRSGSRLFANSNSFKAGGVIEMMRRQFIAGLGVTVMGPLAARAQQPLIPVVGFLSTRSPDEATTHTNAFRRGLEEMGYLEGRSVAVEYRWASGDYSRLQPFVADLLSRPLSVIVATGDPAARAAKAAGFAVPLVFIVGQDPVRSGLVATMNRPGVATGVNFFTGDLGSKRLELLCAMVPSAELVGLLLNPSFGTAAVDEYRQAVATAAQALGREVVVQKAATDAEIESAFAALAKADARALMVQNDPFFDSRRKQIVALSTEHQLPGIFHIREFPADGGLMSYGASLADTYRQVGVYVGKILRGAKPDDLPVLRPTRFELVINTRTAKALGLAVPQSVLIAADELIE